MRRAHPDAQFTPAIEAPALTRALPESREACVAEILRGWFESTVPLTRFRTGARSGAAARPGGDRAGAAGSGRTDSARAVSFTQRRARNRVVPPPLAGAHTPADDRPAAPRNRAGHHGAVLPRFWRAGSMWRGGTQLHGVDGTAAGDPAASGCANARPPHGRADVLPRRIADYEPELLDQLCLSGEVMWGRLSPHPAFERRDRRSRAGACGLRAWRRWRFFFARMPNGCWHGSAAATCRIAVASGARSACECFRRGASFFAEILRDTGRLAGEVEDALWELVAAGLVTADGFENLRALIDPKRGAAKAGAGQRVAGTRPGDGRCCARRGRGDGVCRALRAAAAATMGRGVSRYRGARNIGAGLARHVGGAAPDGDARRNSRRPLCRGIHRGAVRAAGGARSACAP